MAAGVPRASSVLAALSSSLGWLLSSHPHGNAQKARDSGRPHWPWHLTVLVPNPSVRLSTVPVLSPPYLYKTMPGILMGIVCLKYRSIWGQLTSVNSIESSNPWMVYLSICLDVL